jgi:hypothetical protein
MAVAIRMIRFCSTKLGATKQSSTIEFYGVRKIFAEDIKK